MQLFFKRGAMSVSKLGLFAPSQTLPWPASLSLLLSADLWHCAAGNSCCYNPPSLSFILPKEVLQVSQAQAVERKPLTDPETL